MPDQITEVANISWGQRLSRSFTGVIFGLALFILSFLLLWSNEGYSVDRIKTLDTGHKIIVEAPAAIVNPINDSRLVHVSGTATTADIFDDGIFGVRENALKLKRVVKMYQWQETQKTHKSNNMGGSQTQQTSYSYNKAWVGGLIDSSHFKEPQGHENPKTMPYGSREWIARINLGAFNLSEELLAKVDAYQDYPVTPQIYAAMDDRLKNYFKLNDGQYFYGDPANPLIGSIRVHYKIIRPGAMSVIGRQDGHRLAPYDMRDPKGIPLALPPTEKPGSLTGFFSSVWNSVNSNVKKNVDTIAFLQMGNADTDSMFSAALQQNKRVTWLARGAGFLIMWLGLMAILSPIKILFDLIPLLGGLMGASLGLVTGLAALALSLMTIAAAWIYYRPLTGGALVLIAAISGYGILHHLREVSNKKAAGVSGLTPNSLV